jgi:hypothetical protein
MVVGGGGRPSKILRGALLFGVGIVVRNLGRALLLTIDSPVNAVLPTSFVEAGPGRQLPE